MLGLKDGVSGTPQQKGIGVFTDGRYIVDEMAFQRDGGHEREYCVGQALGGKWLARSWSAQECFEPYVKALRDWKKRWQAGWKKYCYVAAMLSCEVGAPFDSYICWGA